MKDFLGNTLTVGDVVVLIRPGYRELVKAKITRFTAKMVFLTYQVSWTNSGVKQIDLTEVKQTPTQLVKVSV